MNLKGAIGMTYLVFIIIAIIGGFFLFMLVLQQREAGGDIAEGTTCQTALRIQYGSTENLPWFVGDIEANCPTIVTKDFKARENEAPEVTKFLADKMARTWEIILEGAFEDDIWNSESAWGDSKCFIVYAITLEPKRGSYVNISKEEFVSYLEQVNYYKVNRTYASFFERGANGSGDYLISTKNIVGNDVTYGVAVSSYDSGYMDFLGLTEQMLPVNLIILSTMDDLESAGCIYI